jgi:hypothetical protein
VPPQTLDRALPVHCTMVRAPPTAQTSLALLPEAPERLFVVPVEALVQALPFQCRMVPSASRRLSS